MPRKRKRVRGTSEHPGVVLIPRQHRSGTSTWQARWKDPRTGSYRYHALADCPNAEARRSWAVAKSRQLAERRALLSSGRLPVDALGLAEAVELFVGSKQAEGAADATLTAYRYATERLLAWGAARGHRLAEELSPVHLSDLLEYLKAEPKRRAKQGGGRGETRGTGGPRSRGAINHTLKTIKAVLNHWRRLGLTPQLDSDAIKDRLAPLKQRRQRPDFLSEADARALLRATLRHDGDTYQATRAEHAQGVGGATRKHQPMAPFVAVALLTGMRFGELVNLKWADVDLCAHQGLGEIVVQPETSKTRMARPVRLEVSPALRELLARMRLRAGGAWYVFGGAEPMPRWQCEAARRRLMRDYEAPAFTWQKLRRTTATFLANAGGLGGVASVIRESQQLGHDPTVAARDYLGIVTPPLDAATLEDAMGIADEIASVSEDVHRGAASEHSLVA